MKSASRRSPWCPSGCDRRHSNVSCEPGLLPAPVLLFLYDQCRLPNRRHRLGIRIAIQRARRAGNDGGVRPTLDQALCLCGDLVDDGIERAGKEGKRLGALRPLEQLDRKSTRLNSSH